MKLGIVEPDVLERGGFLNLSPGEYASMTSICIQTTNAQGDSPTSNLYKVFGLKIGVCDNFNDRIK